MKERRAQAKLISGDQLVKYIDTEYPLHRTIYTAVMRSMTTFWAENDEPNATLCIRREYELYDVKEFKDFTLGIYRERS